MIPLSLAKVKEVARRRPAGYVEDVLSAASSVRGDVILMPEESYVALVNKYRGTPGLGDRVQAVLSWAGITEARVSRLIGRKCKCAERAEALNRAGRAVIEILRPKRG